MEENGSDPILLDAYRYSQVAPPHWSVTELIDRNQRQSFDWKLERSARSLLDPYHPAVRKGEERLATLLSRYADPDLLRHAINKKTPVIFSTDWAVSWGLASTTTGQLFTGNTPSGMVAVSLKKNKLPVNTYALVTVPTKNYDRELLMDRALDTAVHELAHLYHPVGRRDERALPKRIAADKVCLDSFKESLEESLADSTLDHRAREDIERLKNAYNDITKYCASFMEVSPILANDRKSKNHWAKQLAHLQRLYPSETDRLTEVPAVLTQLRHKYGTLVDTVLPNLTRWLDSSKAYNRECAGASLSR